MSDRTETPTSRTSDGEFEYEPTDPYVLSKPDDDWCYAIVRTADGVVLGSDGWQQMGVVEDASFTRDLAWIVPELNRLAQYEPCNAVIFSVGGDQYDWMWSCSGCGESGGSGLTAHEAETAALAHSGSTRREDAMSRWCVTHNCPEEEPSGRCFDWLNDPAVPQLPVCRMTQRKRASSASTPEDGEQP